MSRPPGGRSGFAANAATLGLALLWLARLVPQALAARLQTDECFHAWVSRWIATHLTLPERIDGLYGGFGYFYPPLFHVFGAAAFRAGGLDGFLLVNVAVVALVLGLVALGAARLGGAAAARWAVGLCVANGFLAEHAVRLYVEALSTLLVAGTALWLAAVMRAPRPRDGLVLGLFAGLAIAAKLSALVLPPLLALLALVYALRGRRETARSLAVATAVSLAVALPLFARNAMLFGSPIYPALGRDVNPLVMALNVRHFSPSPLELYGEIARRTGWVCGAFVALALVLAAWRRQAGAEAGIVLALVALALGAPLQPLVEARHLLPAIVACVALAAVILAGNLRSGSAPPARSMRLARIGIDVAVLACAAWAVVAMPRWRTLEDLDEPQWMDAAFAAVHAHVPAGETVLARETYDTFWYADRAANWPIPFGQKDTPIGMFMTADPDSVAAAMRRHRLRWVLLTDEPVPGPFDGADWPAAFTGAIERLGERGRAHEVWKSDDAALWRLDP